MQESQARYSTVSIVLHWTIAALVVANVFVGGVFEEAEGQAKLDMLFWHKSFGVTIVVLTIVRLLWRFAHPWPALPGNMPGWERLLARFTHVGFYVLLLAIPVLGWSAISAAGAPEIKVWGVIPWPNLPLPLSEDLAEALADTHKAFVKAVYVLLVLHIAGALKHHFVNKDEVLARMLPIVRRKA